jgi:hypothetical protein
MIRSELSSGQRWRCLRLGFVEGAGPTGRHGFKSPRGPGRDWLRPWPELAEHIAAVQRDLAATPIDNMPRRGRLTWTIRRGGEAPRRDRRSARGRPPMTARLVLVGAALVFATSCNFNESRWVLRAWAPPARCSLAVRITSRISRPACPAYRRLHEVVILLSSGRV